VSDFINVTAEFTNFNAHYCTNMHNAYTTIYYSSFRCKLLQ